MVGVKIVPYQKGDVYKVKIRPGDPQGLLVEDGDTYSWSMVNDMGEILACSGIEEIDPGIGFFWSFISDDARGHGKMLVKHGRKMITEAFSRGFHRIQAIVRIDRPEYERFIELVGMEKEGLIRKATPTKQDLFLYSIVSEV